MLRAIDVVVANIAIVVVAIFTIASESASLAEAAAAEDVQPAAAGITSISINNNQINCGGLECPAGSYACRLTNVSAEPDLTVATIRRQCRTSDGRVLAELITTAPNKGGEPIRNTSEASIGGSMSFDGGSDGSTSANVFDDEFFKSKHHKHGKHRKHISNVPPKSFFGNAFETKFFKEALRSDRSHDDN